MLDFQQLVLNVPVSENVIDYSVNLVQSTRPNDSKNKTTLKYIEWGAGPRASQFLVIGAKVNAALNGKYSPDIEDVQSVATPILRHRIVRNYKAEADGMTVEKIISRLL